MKKNKRKRSKKPNIKHNTKRKYMKNKYRRRTIKQRGGVCPCAIPLTSTIAGSVGTTVAATLGSIGLYSLKTKKKKPKKKPKK